MQCTREKKIACLFGVETFNRLNTFYSENWVSSNFSWKCVSSAHSWNIHDKINSAFSFYTKINARFRVFNFTVSESLANGLGFDLHKDCRTATIPKIRLVVGHFKSYVSELIFIYFWWFDFISKRSFRLFVKQLQYRLHSRPHKIIRFLFCVWLSHLFASIIISLYRSAIWFRSVFAEKLSLNCISQCNHLF